MRTEDKPGSTNKLIKITDQRGKNRLKPIFTDIEGTGIAVAKLLALIKRKQQTREKVCLPFYLREDLSVGLNLIERKL